MTISDIMAQWTQADFMALQAQGDFSPVTTYAEFIAMKLEQTELARRDRIELYGEDLAEVPLEEPPDLSPDEEAALIEAWAHVAKEREQQAPFSAGIAA